MTTAAKPKVVISQVVFRQDSNEIPKATPVFSRPNCTMMPLSVFCGVTRSRKCKMRHKIISTNAGITNESNEIPKSKGGPFFNVICHFVISWSVQHLIYSPRCIYFQLEAEILDCRPPVTPFNINSGTTALAGLKNTDMNGRLNFWLPFSLRSEGLRFGSCNFTPRLSGTV